MAEFAARAVPSIHPRVRAVTSTLVLGVLLVALLGLFPWIRAAIWISPLVFFTR